MKKANIYDILGWVAAFAVPIAPAFFFGHKVYMAVFAMTTSAILAIPVGVLSAAGLEIVGIYAGHTTMEFWRRGRNGEAMVSAVIMIVYVTIGIYELRGSIGAVMFLIAPLVYVLLALRELLHKDEQTDQRANLAAMEESREDKAHARRLEILAQEQRHAERMERLRASTEPAQSNAMPAQSQQEPAPISYECEDCGRPFATVQALNAHGRFCKGVPVNGASKKAAVV